MLNQQQVIEFDASESQLLAAWCDEKLTISADRFDAGRAIAKRLGAHVDGDSVSFGFWAPELLDNNVSDADIFVELLRPTKALDITQAHAEMQFERRLLPVTRCDAFVFSVVRGVLAGHRDRVGDFYALVWRDTEGAFHRILDPLAMSLPYGAFAPAEVYDVTAMQEAREDKAYFHALKGEKPHKFAPPVSILQLHIPSSTAAGTLASLTRRFQRLAERVERGLPLEPQDELFVGYDAVQPLPVEPTTVYEAGPA